MRDPALRKAGMNNASLSHPAWWLAMAAVGLCALLIRWYYLSHAVVDHPVRGDAIQYYAYAWNLVHHGTFSMAPPGSAQVLPDSFRDPVYPAFLAIWMYASADASSWYWHVLASQGLLGALTVVLLANAARGWLPDRWLIATGLLMAIWPHNVSINGYLLTETLYGFLCALAFVFLRLALRRASVGWMTAAGLAFGLAALTNAVLVPFAILLAIYMAVRKLSPRRLTMTLALSALLIPGCWSMRNMQLPADASSSGRALINLVQGSRPDYHSSFRAMADGDPEGLRTYRAIQHEADVAAANPREGLSRIGARMAGAPVRYLRWYLSKPALLWDWGIRIGQGDIYVYPTYASPFLRNPAFRILASLCWALNPLVMVLALAGCISLLWRGARKCPTSQAAALLLVYVTLVHSILQAEPRYAIPYRGFEILVAGLGLHVIIHWLLRQRRGDTAPAARGSREDPGEATRGG
ncbi:hypothetical protein [Dyella ginsengisoli]|uniref:hypothetical protein n=1 Tax=Dyella ginsengisoli TaxID=363848 RepID=UPI00034B5D31|nr:hypothetical protein [Dyella ginsengisoli]